MVKLIPKNDLVRKLLKHPGGRAFPDSGSADWPDDSFTHRRILDGDVTVEESSTSSTEDAVDQPTQATRKGK